MSARATSLHDLHPDRAARGRRGSLQCVHALPGIPRVGARQVAPAGVALATSGWYFNNTDHRAPHDAWLEEARLVEAALSDDRSVRRLDLRVRLLGAYHDGWVELDYHDVSRYQLDFNAPRGGRGGHQDWRYDEFRLAARGRVEHEIEWWSGGEVGRWLIEAADVTHRWIPMTDQSGGHA